MFTVLLIMFSGIGIGYLCRRIGWLQKLGKPIFYVILLLLFLLGANVGNNQTIVNNLLAIIIARIRPRPKDTCNARLVATHSSRRRQQIGIYHYLTCRWQVTADGVPHIIANIIFIEPNDRKMNVCCQLKCFLIP